MNGIPIKDIPGALMENKKGILANPKYPSHKPGYNPINEGFNLAITQQGQVKITLSREKLARLISNYMSTERTIKEVLEDFYLNCGYELSDEIIQHLNELLEVVK